MALTIQPDKELAMALLARARAMTDADLHARSTALERLQVMSTLDALLVKHVDVQQCIAQKKVEIQTEADKWLHPDIIAAIQIRNAEKHLQALQDNIEALVQ